MIIDWPRPNRQPGWVDAVGLVGLLGFLVARFVPVARLPFWGCAFRKATGWPCPGCGLTRVADRLSHFNVAGAWDANPLGTVAALGITLAIAASFLHLAFGLPIPGVTLSRRELKALQVLLGISVLVNYAFVIIKTRFPHLLL